MRKDLFEELVASCKGLFTRLASHASGRHLGKIVIAADQPEPSG